jgi:hypothetical protein
VSERAEPKVPSFARDYPNDPELSALVHAFEEGDHGLVRTRAPKLVASEDAEVARAARDLVARTSPDPLAKWLFALALLLLLGLSGYWVSHDGPDPHATPAAPAIEYVK